MRIRTHTNPLSCINRFTKFEPDKFFLDFNQQLDLEIGFGQSLFLSKYAKDNPQRCIVGVEVRKKAVNIMQSHLDKEKLKNIYLVHGNGEICLEDMFDDNSLDKVFIFHPDPWIKHRHYKRRLINPNLLKILSEKLKKSGKVYISTDAEFLWHDILKTFKINSCFEHLEDNDFWKNYYSGRWDEISKEKGRKTFFATLLNIKK